MTAEARRILALTALVALLASAALAASARGFRFATLEGEVLAVGEHRGEDEIELLSVTLAPEDRPDEEVTLLLGPVAACQEIGLEVEAGDRLRAKVFVTAEDEPLRAQKVLNVSRRMMVRLRTIRDVPLWNTAGSWQGGPGRAYRGGHHGARQGGAGGPGRGPGGR